MAFENKNPFEQSVERFSSNEVTALKQKISRNAIIDIVIRCLLILLCVAVKLHTYKLLQQRLH